MEFPEIIRNSNRQNETKTGVKSLSLEKIKGKNMKGVSYITDGKSRKKAVVIEMKTLERYDEQIEDLFDAIIAESRRDEPTVSWEDLKKRLKKKGKL